MSEQTQLVAVPPQETAMTVYSTEKGLEPWLQKIRAEIDGFTPDVTTNKGREAIASMAYKVARSKTALDDVGKKLVADLKEIPKKIDAERKRVRDTLDIWQAEVKLPLTEWRAKEDARADHHNSGILRIQNLAEDLHDITAEDLADRIQKIEATVIDQTWEEFEAEAARAKGKALSTLRAALVKREAFEAEQAELARLRAEADARAKADHEAAIAREAAERTQREAEQKAQAEREAAARREQALIEAAERERRDAENQRLQLQLQAEQAERQAAQAKANQAAAEQRAEQQRIDAERRHAEALERARLDEIARQDAAAAEIIRQQQARQADQAHKKAINRAALEAFMAGGMPEDCAKQAVTLIAQRKIPSVSISY